MQNYITTFVNELCQLMAGRCATRAHELRELSTAGRLNPDQSTAGRANALERLGDQFKELATVSDSEELIRQLAGPDHFDEFAPIDDHGLPVTDGGVAGDALAGSLPTGDARGGVNVIHGSYVEGDPAQAHEAAPEAPAAA